MMIVFNKDANEKEVKIQTINLSIDAAEKGGAAVCPSPAAEEAPAEA